MFTLNTTFGSGDVFWWMLELFLFIIWFWLLIVVFGDIFRDQELGGGAKALWVILVILIPYIGVLFYLIFRGHGMAGRSAKEAQAAQDQFDARVRATSASSSASDQIAQAKALLDAGTINQTEFDALKQKALAG